MQSKREEFRKEKKTGAGSATEAIEFYQYALEKNQTWEGKNVNTSNSEQKSQSAKEDMVDNTNTRIAMDMSRARCKVCNTGGDLFRCSQSVCQNTFHFQCVRPPLEGPPPHDWNCAFCDVDYVTGLKPQARKRRIAVAAVRAMEKASKSGIQSQSSKTSKTSAGSEDKESNKNKRTLEDVYENESDNTADKSQRQKLTSGGEKESDEIDNDEKASVIEEIPLVNIIKEEIPLEVLKKLSPKSININSKHGQFHCKFCMDDEATETCCFCACRVCFSKRDRKSTILCDICDAEYHIDCLSPPLGQIPSTDWFCPTCVNVIVKAQRESDGKKVKKGAVLTKAAKGTKGASKSPKAQAKNKVTKACRNILKANYASKQPRTSTGRFASKIASPEKKRGPGRPPKSAAKQATPKPATPKQATPKKSGGTGRGRGRPPSKANLLKRSELAGESDSTKKTSVDSKNDTSKTQRSISKAVSPKKTGRGRGRPPSTSKAAKIEKAEKKSLNETKPDPVKEIVKDVPVPPSIVTKVTSQVTTEGQIKHIPKTKEVSSKVLLQNTKDVVRADQTKRGEAKKDKSVLANLIPKQNVKETISDSEMKNAAAAAIEAIACTVRPNLDKPVGAQKPQSSPTVPQTPASTSAANLEKSSGRESSHKVPRRKPGARECMQISRRFGANVISQQYMETLLVSYFNTSINIHIFFIKIFLIC